MSFAAITPIVASAVAPVALEAVREVADLLDFRSLLSNNVEDESGHESSSKESMFEAINAQAEDGSLLKDGLAKLSESFSKNLSFLLSIGGVDPKQDLELKSDGTGGIQVAGDHPKRFEIEQLLNGSSELKQMFHQLLGQHHQSQTNNSASNPQLPNATDLLDYRAILSGGKLNVESQS